MNSRTALIIVTLAVFSTFAPNLAVADTEYALDRKRGGVDRPPTPAFFPIEMDSLQTGWRALEWGDYDNDGDLDFAITGWIEGHGEIARVYRNDSGAFVDIGANLVPCVRGSVAWGDYDNDGDLDLMISGSSDVLGRATWIYRNVAGAFEPDRISDTDDTSLFSIWGDYDGDGDLDALTVGSYLYRNTAGSFAATRLDQSPSGANAATWLDFDGDDDLDLAIVHDTGTRRISFFENFAGELLPVETSVLGAGESIEWGDVDGDGDPDLLLTGYGPVRPDDIVVTAKTRLLRNDDGTFVEVQTGMPGGTRGTGTLGDYDNDGDLDALLIGDGLHLYRNDGSEWTRVDAGFAHLRNGDAAWGDYDGDGDLDILVSGDSGGSDSRTIIYRNNSPVRNTRPLAPTGLDSEVAGPRARLSWENAADQETVSTGLTYSVRIGSTPGAADVFRGMVDVVTGVRRIPAPGNAGLGSRFVCTLPGTGTYYWSVQAIDNGFLGGPFAQEQSFEITSESDLVDIGGPAITVDLSPYSDLFPAVAMGDYDADGDFDLFVVDDPIGGSTDVVGIFRNENGAFNLVPDAGPSLPFIFDAAWGDADGDGDLDLATVGVAIPGAQSTVYMNEGGTFIDSQAGFIIGSGGDVEWGDYDADGDLDILIQANGGPEPSCRIYENRGDGFVDVLANLESLDTGQVEWGDYDADGDLDVLLVGYLEYEEQIILVFRNDGQSFTRIYIDQIPAYFATGEWGDLDSDGDLDIVVAAEWPTYSSGGVQIYINDAGAFVETNSGISDLSSRSLKLFDFDNNGDLDIITGNGIYLNSRGQFVDSGHGDYPLVDGDLQCGDLDGDGDLDLVVGVPTGQVSAAIRVLRHDTFDLNTLPQPPAGLNAVLDGSDVTLSWDAATDIETHGPELTYNLRVGTTPGGSELVSCMADVSTGRTLVAEMGNTQQVRSRTLRLPGIGEYYWSVQSIDAQFQGSTFAVEESFEFESVTAAPTTSWVTGLKPPHPNPFNAVTTINFTLAAPSTVKIQIFDLAGRLVATILDESRMDGEHTIVWNGRDSAGAPVGSGGYLCRLVTPHIVDTTRLLLVK